MIVLDATVIIAFRDAGDPHHRAAVDFIIGHATRPMLISPVTKAETLVNPARAGRLAQALGLFDELGVVEVAFEADAAIRLAELRAATGSKMPDCCVLLAAQQRGAAVATFDERLRRSAISCGLAVLP